jgi:hypothetical protein
MPKRSKWAIFEQLWYDWIVYPRACSVAPEKAAGTPCHGVDWMKVFRVIVNLNVDHQKSFGPSRRGLEILSC